MEITKLVVEAMETELPATMPFGMLSSQLPNLLPSVHLMMPKVYIIPESLSRPADVFLPTWHGGKPAALDVHIISSLQQSLVHEAAYSPGHALEVGVRRKLTAHLQQLA